MSPSERNLLREQALAWRSAGDDAAELHRVDGDLLTGLGAGDVFASGRTGERERDGSSVACRPFGDHIGDDSSVVLGREDGFVSGSAGDVNAVHPRVASEDRV